MIAESLLGGIFGGLLRLAPEVMKFFDRKNEREHEARMMDREIQVAQMRAEQAMHMMDASVQLAQFDAAAAALKEQGETARFAGRFVAGLSALVRPLVTYWMFALYSMHKIASMLYAHDQGASWRDVAITTWTEQDWTIFSSIVAFWFVSRALEKR